MGKDFEVNAFFGYGGILTNIYVNNGNHRLAILQKHGLDYNIPVQLLLYSDNKHLSDKWIKKLPSKKELVNLMQVGES